MKQFDFTHDWKHFSNKSWKDSCAFISENANKGSIEKKEEDFGFLRYFTFMWKSSILVLLTFRCSIDSEYFSHILLMIKDVERQCLKTKEKGENLFQKIMFSNES